MGCDEVLVTRAEQRGKMVISVFVVVVLMLTGSGHADEQRLCYKCRAKERCLGLDKSSLEKCNPDVKFCVKKQTFSRVTGAVVTERYCGGRDFLDFSKDLVDNKCYMDIHQQDGRRTSATICYCSYNYCNKATPQSSYLYPLGLCIVITASLVVL